MQLEYRLTRLTTRAGFCYNGESAPYFDIPLFVGDQPWPFWRTERTLELALIHDFVARFDGPGLEVGHVMALHMDRPHTVVDKYEQGPGVLNLDIVDYRSMRRIFPTMKSSGRRSDLTWSSARRSQCRTPMPKPRTSFTRYATFPDGLGLVTARKH